jgi:hypothetical protein
VEIKSMAVTKDMRWELCRYFFSLLSGANYAPWVPPFPAFMPMPAEQPGKGIGHFFGAMRIDAFRPADEFKKHMDKWIGGFRTAKTIPGEEKVLISRRPEREIEAERIKTGIPIVEAWLVIFRTSAISLKFLFLLADNEKLNNSYSFSIYLCNLIFLNELKPLFWRVGGFYESNEVWWNQCRQA